MKTKGVKVLLKYTSLASPRLWVELLRERQRQRETETEIVLAITELKFSP
jgi:hypothetical protein